MSSTPPMPLLSEVESTETEMLEPAGGKQMQMGGGAAGLDLMDVEDEEEFGV